MSECVHRVSCDVGGGVGVIVHACVTQTQNSEWSCDSPGLCMHFCQPGCGLFCRLSTLINESAYLKQCCVVPTDLS